MKDKTAHAVFWGGKDKKKTHTHMLIRHGKISTSALWTEIKVDSRLKV